MSKKQISNRLDKLFDNIKEEEKAVNSRNTPKFGVTRRLPQLDIALSSEEYQKTKPASLEVQVDTSGTYATMSLPLRMDKDIWGTIQIVDDTPQREWDKEAQMLVQQVTEQLSLALEKARILQESQRQTEELAILNKVATAVSNSLDLQEDLEIIAKEISKITSAIHVGITLLDQEKNNLILITDYPKIEEDAGLKIPLENNFAGRTVIKTRKPYAVPNISTNPIAAGIKDIMLKRGTESLIIFPLLSGNEVIGTLGVDFADPTATLSKNQTELIQTILLQASTSIETARLFQETQLSEARARIIVENAPEAIIIIDMETGLFTDPNENALHLYGLSKEEILKMGPGDLSPPKQPGGRTSDEIALEQIEIALAGGAPTFEWVHLHSSGEEIFCEIRLVQLPDATRTLVRASIVDIAERKYNDLIQRAISNISNAALSTQSLRELIQEIHQIVGTLMPADNFYIALYDDVRDLLTFPYYIDKFDTALPPQKPGKGLTSYVLHSKESLLADDKVLEKLKKSGEVNTSGTKGINWLGVPLTGGDKVLGVMAVQTYDTKAKLTKQHRETLTFVGKQISSALESKQSELELRTLFSAMDDVIFVVDSETRYLRIAPTNPSGLYRPPEELLGQRMDQVLPKKIYTLFKDSIRKALDSNKTVNIEYPLDIGEKEIWFYASLSKLSEDQVYWVARDITERKESEKALQDAHTRIQYILDSTTVPTHITSMDGIFLYANQAVADTLGLPLDEIVGSQAGRFYFSSEERDAFNLDMAKHGTLINVENRYLRGNNEMFWGLSSTRTFEYEGKEALLSTVIDITERKKTEAILQRQNEYMAAAAEVGRLVTSTLDTDILFRRAVNLLPEHFGYYHAAIFTAEEAGFDVILREATGKAGEEMKENKHSLKIGSQSIVGTATETGKPYIVNDISKEPNHHINPLLPETKAEAAIPLKIGRRIIGALDLQATEVDAFSPEDIEVLQLLTDQFATAIDNARSYKLAQDAFLEMRELEKLKSQFLANMSHELRTPLNSIIGFSRVILKGIDGPITDLQQQDLTAIYNSGQHLLGLINDILDLSKIEAGKMELTFDEIDIEKLIKSVMSTVMGLVKDKPVRLEEKIEANLPTVKADSMRVRQILINLFSNAAKFTDEGNITVIAERKDSSILISVKDSGPGISEEDQQKLFQAFSQVDASATRATGGSGLGLSISKQLVTMHGGEIGLNSAEGKGSTFYFTLPIYDNTPLIAETGEEKEETQKKNDAPLILAIDDDQKIINLYQRYLKEQGYQMVALTEPKKAVARAKELQPYAITLDIMMPGYDGWQVLEDLKSTPETRHIPVIICSIVENTEKGYALGATDYLLKPILDDDLINALNRLNDDGEIYDILLIDDDPDDLRLLEKLLNESENYNPIIAEGGVLGWEKIVNNPPQAVVLDLFMPEKDGFQIMDAMQASSNLRDIPVIVISGGDLTTTQQEQLDTLNLHLIQKGTLHPDDLLSTLGRSLSHLKITQKK